MKRIMCLPVAGQENPYQMLMMKGLRDGGNTVFHGQDTKFLAVFKSSLGKKVDFVHFDWIHQFYLTRYNRLIWVKGLFFVFDICLAKLFYPRIQWIWTVHNIYPHQRGRTSYDRLIRSFFASKCKNIRVFTEETAVQVSEEFNLDIEKIKIIAEGSYVDYYRKIDNAPICFKKKSFTCLYLGQIKDYKGVDDLIETARELKSEEIHFLIVGKIMQSHLVWLESSAQNLSNVTFRNSFVKESELKAYYDIADVVVLPFKKITNSGSAIMAMGFAKPIVAPRQGVLKVRLAQQQDLLYDEGQLKKAIMFAKRLPEVMLKRYGYKNLQSLELSSWNDFCRLFMD